MSELFACLALLAWGFGAGFMVGRDRKERADHRKKPFRFRWKCADCESWMDVSSSTLDGVARSEAWLDEVHRCPRESP